MKDQASKSKNICRAPHNPLTMRRVVFLLCMLALLPLFAFAQPEPTGPGPVPPDPAGAACALSVPATPWNPSTVSVGTTATMSVNATGDCGTGQVTFVVFEWDPLANDQLFSGTAQIVNGVATLSHPFTQTDYAAGGNESGNEDIFYRAFIGAGGGVDSPRITFSPGTSSGSYTCVAVGGCYMGDSTCGGGGNCVIDGVLTQCVPCSSLIPGSTGCITTGSSGMCSQPAQPGEVLKCDAGLKACIRLPAGTVGATDPACAGKQAGQCCVEPCPSTGGGIVPQECSATQATWCTASTCPAGSCNNPVGGWSPLVPCGRSDQCKLTRPDNTPCDECQFCDFFKLIQNIVLFTVFELIPPIAIFFLALGGLMMIISAGNESRRSKGKDILRTTVIGIVVIFTSWIIINTVLKTFATNIAGGSTTTWYAFSCGGGAVPAPAPGPGATPFCTLLANGQAASTITGGGSVTLSWTTTDAVDGSIGGVGSIASSLASGSTVAFPSANTTYLLTVAGSGGATATCSASVNISVPAPPPCTPQCTGKVCGGDGCGGTCPPGCVPPQTCEVTGQCTIPPPPPPPPGACTPQCTGKVCGGDGCGGTCPPGCSANEVCNVTTNQCECGTGTTSCGGTCLPNPPCSGACRTGSVSCVGGALVCGIVPDGVSCGTSQTCIGGSCVDRFSCSGSACALAVAGSFTEATCAGTCGPPTCTFSANPAIMLTGNSSTLTWTVGGVATSASMNNGVGAVSPSGGSVNVSPAGTTDYVLTVTNAQGSSTCAARVQVNLSRCDNDGTCDPWTGDDCTTCADCFGNSNCTFTKDVCDRYPFVGGKPGPVYEQCLNDTSIYVALFLHYFSWKYAAPGSTIISDSANTSPIAGGGCNQFIPGGACGGIPVEACGNDPAGCGQCPTIANVSDTNILAGTCNPRSCSDGACASYPVCVDPASSLNFDVTAGCRYNCDSAHYGGKFTCPTTQSQAVDLVVDTLTCSGVTNLAHLACPPSSQFVSYNLDTPGTLHVGVDTQSACAAAPDQGSVEVSCP